MYSMEQLATIQKKNWPPLAAAGRRWPPLAKNGKKKPPAAPPARGKL